MVGENLRFRWRIGLYGVVSCYRVFVFTVLFFLTFYFILGVFEYGGVRGRVVLICKI